MFVYYSVIIVIFNHGNVKTRHLMNIANTLRLSFHYEKIRCYTRYIILRIIVLYLFSKNKFISKGGINLYY